MQFDFYKYIVVEGPIGVGKTTLASKIAARFRAQTLLEQPSDNPFLERFYRDSARYALPAQMCFLFQRVNQLQAMARADLFNAQVVSDFLLDKDPLFARLTLDHDELDLYNQLYERVHPQAPTPDLLIYLQASPETLIDRVRKRGVAIETGISEPYLTRLCESYSRFFHDYDKAPLLIVNTEHLNPINRDEDFELLLTHITNMRGKREFFSRGE
ncbi:MAG: deoxynucleoside kinase [Burkholderiaceae bacterium]